MAETLRRVGLTLITLVLACGSDGAPGSGDGGLDRGTLDVQSSSDAPGTTDSRLRDIPDVPPDPRPDEPDRSLAGEDGEACGSDDDCDNGNCLNDAAGFPDGVCSPPVCGLDVPCRGTSVRCYDGLIEQEAFCTRICLNHEACRDGYRCEQEGRDAGACVPDDSAPRPDGASCDDAGDCLGDTCLEAPENPGGHCTTLDCASDEDCAGTADGVVCVPNVVNEGSTCRRRCDDLDDCRPQYVCATLSDEVAYCAPNPPREGIDVEGLPFDIICAEAGADEQLDIAFEVPPDAESFTLGLLAQDGERITPTRLIREGADDLTFEDEYGDQVDVACLRGFWCGLTAPWTETRNAGFTTGAQTLTVSTRSGNLCRYVLTEQTAGSTLDLNVVLVNLTGPRAADAPEHDDLSDVLDQVGELFSQTGLTLGEVRFVDPDVGTRTRYSMIRTYTDFERLRSRVLPAGETVDELLAVNVFLVVDILVGPLGEAGGIPGPPGLHGTAASGVVVSTEPMGTEAGNHLLATTITHEVGHYLGLQHTTEIRGLTDPLEDTPSCPRETLFFDTQACPDIENIMFPLAHEDAVELTAGQTFMLLRNPLTKD